MLACVDCLFFLITHIFFCSYRTVKHSDFAKTQFCICICILFYLKLTQKIKIVRHMLLSLAQTVLFDFN